MAQALTPVAPGGLTVRQSGGVVATPLDADTAAIGEVFRRLTYIVTLLEQRKSSMQLSKDIGLRMRAELTVGGDIAKRLTATLGEQISIERLLMIADLLIQLDDGMLGLIAEAFDAIETAIRSNLQGQAALEAVYATGMDGAYGDTQRRAG